MTSLPTWALYLVGIGSPVLAFAGGLIGQFITRRGAVELERRSKREEVMRILRWAAELGVSPEEAKARLGRAQLETLLDTDILDEEERDFRSHPQDRRGRAADRPDKCASELGAGELAGWRQAKPRPTHQAFVSL